MKSYYVVRSLDAMGVPNGLCGEAGREPVCQHLFVDEDDALSTARMLYGKGDCETLLVVKIVPGQMPKLCFLVGEISGNDVMDSSDLRMEVCLNMGYAASWLLGELSKTKEKE